MKAMSESESIFIKKLRITLISVLGPMIITGLILTGVNLQRINTNERRIQLLESMKVDKEINLAYYNELRELIRVTKLDLQKDDTNYAAEISKINNRLDHLYNQMYDLRQRGGSVTDQNN